MDIGTLLPYLISIGTGIAGFIFGKRERDARVKSSEIRNESEISAEWMKLYTEMKQEVDSLRKKVEELQEGLYAEKKKRVELEILLKKKDEKCPD